jgi:hypothetical protein
LTQSGRHCVAWLLAGLATFGLVLAPVLHAQLHASEAEEERDAAIAAAFQIGFDANRGPEWYAALLAAVGEAFGEETGSPEVEPAHHHHGAERHHHSHGRGPHGAGSLEHFALAIHSAAAPPPLPAPEKVPGTPVNGPVVLHLTPNYLVPEFSQGPPRC